MTKGETWDDFEIGEDVLADLLISMQREKKNVQRYPENYHKGYLKEVEKEIARLKEMRAESLYEDVGRWGAMCHRKKKPVAKLIGKRVVKRVIKKAPKRRVAVKTRRR